MSEIPRYLPLPDAGMNVTAPEAVNLSGAVNRTFPSSVRQVLTLFEPLAAPLGALAAGALVTMALLLLLTMWYGREVTTFARYLALARRQSETVHGESIEYTYAGMKLVLRRYYLRLREALGCRRCTPRELAARSSRRELEEFAKLYEDVVYGSKEAGPESERVLARLDDSG